MISIRYKGMRIKIKLVNYGFNHISFNYNSYILIYINKNLSKNAKRRILHYVIKKARI